MPLHCTTDENLREFSGPARVTTLKRRKRRAPFRTASTIYPEITSGNRSMLPFQHHGFFKR
ncbi:MAG: hypothetical protein JWM68_1717 [Verrucomicrobiales bacterium]|nr:hypothetical protein [Verrucomicrobiales bacterium]